MNDWLTTADRGTELRTGTSAANPEIVAETDEPRETCCSARCESLQLVTSPHALRRRHLAVQDIMLRPYPRL